MTEELKTADISKLCKIEKYLINHYVEHPRVSRFGIAVFLAFLTMMQHIMEKYGYLKEVGDFIATVIKLISTFFLPGGV